MFYNTQMQSKSQPAHNTNGGFPQVLQSMAIHLKCAQERDVPQGRLNWKALHFKYLSFMAEFQEPNIHTPKDAVQICFKSAVQIKCS